ncbi:CopG family transcriptional regulator [Corynebacterium sp. S7]
MAMTLRLSTEEDRALVLLATAWGCSKQEAARRAVVTTATRLLDDEQLATLARDIIPGHAALEARVNQARTSISFED